MVTISEEVEFNVDLICKVCAKDIDFDYNGRTFEIEPCTCSTVEPLEFEQAKRDLRESNENWVRHFNALVPIGTTVRAWPGLRFHGPGIECRTKSEAWRHEHNGPVVFLDWGKGWCALSHIEIIME